MSTEECQSMQIQHMANGDAKLPPLSVIQRFKVELRRKLPFETYRSLKRTIDRYLLLIERSESDRNNPAFENALAASPLEAGDLVRIRSADEIQKTLNRWKEYKGSGFMDDMWEYCDTEHRVLKPVKRFVDERDYKVKKLKGVVLLEGLTCKGTPILGGCDRNCYYFWREAWLEKIDQNQEPDRQT